MARQIQIRRGTAAEHALFTGEIGEVTMDTTNKTLCVHDGTTVGGIKLAKQSELSDYANINASNLTVVAKNNIAQLSLPNYTRMIDLTIGATESEYTAPGTGWVAFRMSMNDSGNMYVANTMPGGATLQNWVTAGKNNLHTVYVPVVKNSIIKIHYANASITPECYLRFFYAHGAQ